MKIDLLSPYSPLAAATRLKDAVPSALTPDTPQCVTGNGTEDHMILWVHRPRLRNDFKTMLAAEMKPFEGGTRIRGRVGAPRSASLFMGCWFGFVFIFLLVGLATLSVTSGSARWAGLPFIAVPVLMLAIGGFIIWIGRQHGRRDREAILAFLHQTIGARPRDPRDI